MLTLINPENSLYASCLVQQKGITSRHIVLYDAAKSDARDEGKLLS